MTNTNQNSSKKILPSHLNLSHSCIEPMLSNIRNLILKWGEAAGPFLTIEPLMRFIAELHPPLRNKIIDLINHSKKKSRYRNYWDCDPTYLTAAIKDLFGKIISSEELDQISKFPAMRGKLIHGNFIELMEIMGIEPTSRQISALKGQRKKERLKPGEIYESFLSMESNHVFSNLRQYSEAVRETLQEIIRKLAK